MATFPQMSLEKDGRIKIPLGDGLTMYFNPNEMLDLRTLRLPSDPNWQAFQILAEWMEKKGIALSELPQYINDINTAVYTKPTTTLDVVEKR